MRFEIHHHFHNRFEEKIMAQLDSLKGDSAALTAKVTEILAYLKTVPQLVADAVTAAEAGDQATVDQIDADIKADIASLSSGLPTPPAPATPAP